MTILVLGSNGQLGRCLMDQLQGFEKKAIFASRSDLDIGDFDDAKNKIRHINPDLIINASAFTAVDKAEDARDQAYRINQHAMANIANVCAELNCGLIHISTDYVFDGMATEPYIETDHTNPQGVYGDSKLQGEREIQVSECRYIIIRTSWVFSEYGNNFLKTMLKIGSERNELNIVGDQIGCPTYAQDLASCIVNLTEFFQKDDFESQILHFCGDEPCSWYQFALEIFSCGADFGLPTPEIVGKIASEDFPTRAPRPAFSAMDCLKLKNNFHLSPSDWREAIPHVIKKLVNESN